MFQKASIEKQGPAVEIRLVQYQATAQYSGASVYGTPSVLEVTAFIARAMRQSKGTIEYEN